MTTDPLARNYACTLADGQRLTLCFEEELGAWIDRFAAITGLERVQECTSPTCFVGRETGRTFGRRSAGDGWTEYALPWVRLRYGFRSGEVICGLLDRERDSDLGASIRLKQKDQERRIREIIQMDGVSYGIFLHALRSGGLPLHAALVSLGGSGYLIAGRGNTGKTTCARRVPPPWRSWCDDLVLAVKTDAGYRAHALPTWSDHIRDGECGERRRIDRHIPIGGVFFLEQSAVDEAVPVSPGAAAAALYRSAADKCDLLCNAGDPGSATALRRQVFLNAWSLAAAVPAFRLRATLTGRFWETMAAAAPPEEVRAG
ncbi:MAG: SynChlorMet cassette protein ScmC [Methanoculleus horonobensis]|nr:SynChlorMet cassette protein ScmC [Methanoculleus horonobensis]MDD4251528.1 SynChlorMet cassette protein ScmC [Methanoculleus horonobensis]